jgi:hypothetical protein
MWDLTRIALDFFGQHLPFDAMEPADQLVTGAGAWCLAAPGDIFAVYLPDGGSAQLDLGADTSTYDVRWFDPRQGGGLQTGPVPAVTGPGWVSLGTPPSAQAGDWALRVSVQDAPDAPPQIVAAAALALGQDLGVGALVQDPDGGDDVVAVVAWFFDTGGSFLASSPLPEVGDDIWGLLFQDVPPIPSGTWPIAVTAVDAAGQQDVFVTTYVSP